MTSRKFARARHTSRRLIRGGNGKKANGFSTVGARATRLEISNPYVKEKYFNVITRRIHSKELSNSVIKKKNISVEVKFYSIREHCLFA